MNRFAMNHFATLWNPEVFYARGLAEGQRLRATKAEEVAYALLGCSRVCPGASHADILDTARNVHRQRLNAVPDLARYPELDGCRAALEAQERGLAVGAGLDEPEVALLREAFWLSQMSARAGGVLPSVAPPQGCTGVYIAESPQGPLAGNNWDITLDFASLPVPGQVWRTGGIGTIAVSCGIFLDEEPSEIFPADVDYIVRELAVTLDEALELYTRYNSFWGPRNLLVFDAHGDSAVIEKSACRFGIRRGDGYSYTTAMHMETPAMKPYLRARRDEYLRQQHLNADSLDETYWRGAEARHHNLARLTEAAAANPSFEALRAVMQNHSDYPSKICLHGESPHPDAQAVEHTVSTTIYEIEKESATCWQVEKDGIPACQKAPRHLHFA